MLKRVVIMGLCVLSIGFFVLAWVSVEISLPEDPIVIPYDAMQSGFFCRVSDGFLHVVYVQPDKAVTLTNTDEVALGVFYSKSMTLNGTVADGMGVSLWFVAGILMLYPIFAFRAGPLRRRRYRRQGRCVQCGYSLKALSEPRCPECGTAIVTESPGGLG